MATGSNAKEPTVMYEYVPKNLKESIMLHYAFIFFVIALIAAVFGFSGIAASAAGVAQVLFVIFLILAVVSFLYNMVKGRKPTI